MCYLPVSAVSRRQLTPGRVGCRSLPDGDFQKKSGGPMNSIGSPDIFMLFPLKGLLKDDYSETTSKGTFTVTSRWSLMIAV